MAELGSVLSSDGTKIHFEVRGQGESVVLLHGLACTRHMWTPVADLLVAAGRRVVAVDLRGHGDSQRVVGGYGLDQLADDTRAVLGHVDAKASVLVGHSAGGIQAIAFASSLEPGDPLTPAEVITIGTSLSLDRWQERMVLAFSASPAFYGLLATPVIGHAIVKRGAFAPKPGRVAVDSTVASARACRRGVKQGWVRALSDRSYVDLVNAISTKVRLGAGDRDSAFSIERLRASLAKRSDRETFAIPHAGHMAPIEQPTAIVEKIFKRK